MGVEDMVHEGVRRAYNHPDNKLRASVLADPAGKRTNTKDNTPGVVNVRVVPGNTVEVIVAAKGGGSEAKSKFAMLNPSDSIVDWVLKTVPTMGAGWCPPGMLGIGIGGTAEKAMLLAKEALMEPIDIVDLQARGASNRAEELRLELYDKVNALGIGAQGLGGLTTVLDIKVKDYPTHAANLPIAMIPNCAATRHAHFVLDGSGPVMLDPPSLEDWPKLTYDASKGRRVDLDTLTKEDLASWQPGEVLLLNGKLLTGRDAAHKRIVEMLNKRRIAARRPARPFHLLRRPGRSGARRSRRPRRPDHRHAHGQVHRTGARADRPARHGRQGRTRPGRDRRHPQARLGLSDGGRRRGLPGVEGDQGVEGRRLRRPRHGSDLRIHRAGHAGHGGGRFQGHVGARDRSEAMAGAHRENPGGGRVIAPILVEHDAQGQAFKVRFEQHHGYVRAYVHEGRDSLEVSTAMWHLLGTHCRTHGATRLLVVEDLDGTVPLEQIDDVIAAMADAGFGAIRTAFVELQDDLQGSEHGRSSPASAA